MLQRIVQDENSSVLTSRKGNRDVENAAVPSKQSAKGPRKALGNITNVASRGEKPPQGKTPAPSLRQAKGRPLEDITNRLKPPVRPQEHKDSDRPALAGPASKPKSQLDLRAERYASEGVEQLAGKSWQQLQAEATQMQDEAIAARVAAFTSVPYRSVVPYFTQDLAAKGRLALSQPVQQPPSPTLSPREGPDEWDGLPASTTAAQLPVIPANDLWGIDSAALQENDSSCSDDDEDSCTDSPASKAAMQWLDDLDAACDNL